MRKTMPTIALAAALFLGWAQPAAACTSPTPPQGGTATPAVSTAAGTFQARVIPGSGASAGVVWERGELTSGPVPSGTSYLFVDADPSGVRVHGVSAGLDGYMGRHGFVLAAGPSGYQVCARPV